MAASFPTGVAAACTSTTRYAIKVSWTASTQATSYTIYQAKSTTTTPGTYTSVKSGTTGTSWTTGTLTTGYNYWNEVAAVLSTKWTSAKSAATGETTISSTGCQSPRFPRSGTPSVLSAHWSPPGGAKPHPSAMAGQQLSSTPGSYWRRFPA